MVCCLSFEYTRGFTPTIFSSCSYGGSDTLYHGITAAVARVDQASHLTERGAYVIVDHTVVVLGWGYMAMSPAPTGCPGGMRSTVLCSCVHNSRHFARGHTGRWRSYRGGVVEAIIHPILCACFLRGLRIARCPHIL